MHTEGSHNEGDQYQTVAALRRDVDDLLTWRAQLPAPLRPDGLTAANERRELTTSQAAQILGRHRSTIVRWCETGRIPAHRLPEGSWRIPADTLTNPTGEQQ